ncbi:MAG: leucyl/phenylalanyl-tRNA--protein transferase [Bacteroidota bacterium]
MISPGPDPRLVLWAYAEGFFPMADPATDVLSWFSPDPRAVFPLDALRPSRSLRRVVRSGLFEVRMDSAFGEVIAGCASREETWISDGIRETYIRLHRMGSAHSVESWHGGRLAGGLYGVALGGAFFGESMFSRKTDASKVAFVHLVDHLRARGFLLLDAQFMTGHLRRLGAVDIPRAEYLEILKRAVSERVSFREG